ncbi:MAG: HupE/UreJ family protein [Proteobacteria bacterium]|nr:HupE/UreJ family protein [Pseudomonadota bacterium]
MARLVATVTAYSGAQHPVGRCDARTVCVLQTLIEAAIAPSVMFVAAEIHSPGKRSPRSNGACAVGRRVHLRLLHGFVFAGALREVGLVQSDTPVALLFFNVGVGSRQLMFILAVVAILWPCRDSRARMSKASAGRGGQRR